MPEVSLQMTTYLQLIMCVCVARVLEDGYLTIRSSCTKIVPRTFKQTTCKYTYIHTYAHARRYMFIHKCPGTGGGNRETVRASQRGVLLLFTSFSFCCLSSSEMFQTGTTMETSTCTLEKRYLPFDPRSKKLKLLSVKIIVFVS